MPRETESNAEWIKQRIDLYKENLKLINSFYLPLLSGIAILFVTDASKPIILRFFWALIGLIVLSCLTMVKNETTRRIKRLIDQLL
jgi:hypothetical protein